MPKLRLPIRCRRGGPWLALGVAATLVALPGVAHAEGSGSSPTDPLGTVTDQLGNLPTDPSQLGSGQDAGSGTGTADNSSSSTSSSAADLPAPPPSPLAQIQAALEQAGVSAKCADSVQNDLMQLQTDIPGSVQAIIDALTSAGQGGSPPSAADITKALQDLLNGKLPSGSTSSDTTSAADTPSTSPTAVADDLQKLVTDFVTNCIPAPPSGLPSTPTSPSSSSTQQEQAQTQPQTQPAATTTAAQPVSYPGYAATGGIATVTPASDERPSDPVPLSVLGGVLLVSTATAVGVRFRVRRGGR